jgi:hypothetical protein
VAGPDTVSGSQTLKPMDDKDDEPVGSRTILKLASFRVSSQEVRFWELWRAVSRHISTDPAHFRIADHPPEARECYFKRYTTVVSVSAGSGVGSPYISHECPADSLRFAAIHFLIASCASFMRLYGPRWTATAASPP